MDSSQVTSLLLVSIPIISTAKTVSQNLDVVKWIHFPGADMAAKKKTQPMWKCRDGREILISKMDDLHLANSIKMIVRQWHARAFIIRGKLMDNKPLVNMLNEAKRRKFQVHFRDDCPYDKDGRLEYVDVILPNPRSRLDIGYFPTDWDSRIE